jgi:hypothetical protein
MMVIGVEVQGVEMMVVVTMTMMMIMMIVG